MKPVFGRFSVSLCSARYMKFKFMSWIMHIQVVIKTVLWRVMASVERKKCSGDNNEVGMVKASFISGERLQPEPFHDSSLF